MGSGLDQLNTKGSISRRSVYAVMGLDFMKASGLASRNFIPHHSIFILGWHKWNNHSQGLDGQPL